MLYTGKSHCVTSAFEHPYNCGDGNVAISGIEDLLSASRRRALEHRAADTDFGALPIKSSSYRVFHISPMMHGSLTRILVSARLT